DTRLSGRQRYTAQGQALCAGPDVGQHRPVLLSGATALGTRRYARQRRAGEHLHPAPEDVAGTSLITLVRQQKAARPPTLSPPPVETTPCCCGQAFRDEPGAARRAGCCSA